MDQQNLSAPPCAQVSVAELHRLAAADYEQAATQRAAAEGAARDQLAFARAHAAEAVTGR